MALFAKLYTDILGDEKLMRAARSGCRHLQLLPWLIAFAKKAEDHGRLTVGGEPADPLDISRQIPNSSPRSVEKCLTELLSINVLTIEEGKFLRFSAWEKRSGDGKRSDSPEAIRDRVQRHRARRKGLTPPDPQASLPIEGNGKRVTHQNGNAVEIELEIEQEKERRAGVTRRPLRTAPRSARSGPLNTTLPTGVLAFVDRFYPVAGERRIDVEDQLAVLAAGGRIDDRRITVLAHGIDRLERKCREVLTESATIRDLDAAIAVLFAKLADTSDLSVERVDTERRELQSDERLGADARHRAAAWEHAHPDLARQLRDELLAEMPGDGALIEQTREWAFVSRASRQSEPIGTEPGAVPDEEAL